jgi:hypothetical protein
MLVPTDPRSDHTTMLLPEDDGCTFLMSKRCRDGLVLLKAIPVRLVMPAASQPLPSARAYDDLARPHQRRRKAAGVDRDPAARPPRSDAEAAADARDRADDMHMRNGVEMERL